MLRSQGVRDESLIPGEMGTGGTVRASDLKWSEHKRLLEWLAESIDMASKVSFNVPEPEVVVGGHRAMLGRMSQWRLNVSGGLRLSAPDETEWEVAAILSKMRSNRLRAEELEEFAEAWLLVTTELVAEGAATPALFLINKVTERAIVVSAWPTFPEPPAAAAPASAPAFDPTAFFGQAPEACPPPATPAAPARDVRFTGQDGFTSTLVCSEGGGMEWIVDCGDGEELCERIEELGVSFNIDDQFTLMGPLGYAIVADPAPGPEQRLLVSGLVAMALEQGVRVQRSSTPMVVPPSAPEPAPGRRPSTSSVSSSLSTGDHVEVKYKGSWFRGVLQDLQGGVAHVNCDVDESGVITVAPIDSVRLVDFAREGHETECGQVTENCS